MESPDANFPADPNSPNQQLCLFSISQKMSVSTHYSLSLESIVFAKFVASRHEEQSLPKYSNMRLDGEKIKNDQFDKS
jgi:hypothetical protein